MSIKILKLLAGSDDPRLALFDQLNAFVQPRCLRHYQQTIWRTGQFNLTDQSTGVTVACDATLYSPYKAYAWRFPAPGNVLWLLSSGISNGYSIDAIFHSTTRTVILGPEGNEGFASMLATQTEREQIPIGPAGAYLIVGHPNFAHFIWNEMSALLALEGQPSRLTEVRTTFEPILPLGELLTWPPDLTPQQITVEQLALPNSNLHAGVLFSAGSTLVTKATRDRVLQRCTAYAGKPPEATAKRIWLSLRLLYRHPINQVEAFCEFLTELGQSGEQYEILLDGYSLPHDLNFPGRHDIERETGYNQAVAQLAREIINTVRLPSLKIIDLTQCDLPTAMSWTAGVDAYVCHHGTQQHKIGWLSSKPGLIHVSLYFLADLPAGWVAGQAEGAALPRYLPAEYVEDCESENERQNQPFFADYRFADPRSAGKRMAQEVIEILKEGEMSTVVAKDE